MAKNELYDFSVDMWSFGIMIYEMVTGYSPFSTEKTEDVINKVKEFKDFTEIEDRLKETNVSNNLINLISKLITSDISKRMIIEEFFTYEWVSENLKTYNIIV
jgi:serine/threonine protein kinase